VNGRAVITLELQMYVGAPDEGNEVWVEGRPALHVRCENGFSGDITMARIMVNAAMRVASLPSGLWTMKDLPPAHFHAT